MKKDDFEKMTALEFISAKEMIIICLFIEIIVQIFAIMVQPTAWWTWQLLGFIAATNLGAVVLAIFAQRSADKIGAVYRRVFTSDFYETITVMSDIRRSILEQAEQDDSSFDTDIIAPELYKTFRDYFETKQNHIQIPTPELKVPYISHEEVSFINDDELFRDDAGDS